MPARVRNQGTIAIENKLNEYLSQDYNRWRSQGFTGFEVWREGDECIVRINDAFQGKILQGSSDDITNIIIDSGCYIEMSLNEWAARDFWCGHQKWRLNDFAGHESTKSYKTLIYKAPWNMDTVLQFGRNKNDIEYNAAEYLMKHCPEIYGFCEYIKPMRDLGYILYSFDKYQLCKHLKPLWAKEPFFVG